MAKQEVSNYLLTLVPPHKHTVPACFTPALLSLSNYLLCKFKTAIIVTLLLFSPPKARGDLLRGRTKSEKGDLTQIVQPESSLSRHCPSEAGISMPSISWWPPRPQCRESCKVLEIGCFSNLVESQSTIGLLYPTDSKYSHRTSPGANSELDVTAKYFSSSPPACL